MNHRGVSCNGKDVAGDFDGALFGGPLDFLNVSGIGIRADLPDVAENGSRVGNEKSRKFPGIIPGADDGTFVNFFSRFVEIEINRRNIGLDTVHADIALALLFGIVKRMCVEERPDELAADIFEAEFECCMLENGVMAAVEGGSTNVEALFISDF